MKIPKIEFRYSNVYDNRYRESPLLQKKLEEKNESYPTSKEITNYIGKVEPLWRRKESAALTEMSKVTSLKWREKEIICYIIGYGRSFSDPLTVRLYKNKNGFIDTLTHELIHQIFIQNPRATTNWWKDMSKRYKEDSRHTKIHVLVHAVHSHIYLNVFNKRRLTDNIRKDQNASDYARSWQIVQEEGHENIIKKFKSLTK
jgi:hypothetical protein